MSGDVDILVVGAGPTGLALALQAHDSGARVRIVERRPEPFRPSRALILHPRTLEALRPLGVIDSLLARADTAPQVHLRLGRREVHLSLGGLGLPDTAFPHLTLARQTDVEEVLAQALADRGVAVERGTELTTVEDAGDHVRATLRTPGGPERVVCAYLAGCDGQESIVRRIAGIGWPGAPYHEEVILADAELAGDLTPGTAHVAAGRDGLLFVFALGERATWRILATRAAGHDPLPYGRPGPPVSEHELQARLDAAGLDARITGLVWSGRYALQRRLATHFRRGRLFLAGDAAHASSPAGGQGMNTGIQDALNLGWKLAYVPAAHAPDLLLDSYERERHPVARQVLRLTHLGFWAEANTGVLPGLLRDVLAPLAIPAFPALATYPRPLAPAIRLLTQLRVAYPNSPLSVEGHPRLAAGPRAGQRLPDATVTVDGRQTRLHALLARPGIHLLLQRDAADLDHAQLGSHVGLYRLTSTPGTGVIAVRPDGYIGFRCGVANLPQLRTWLALVGAAPLHLPAT